MFIMLITCQSLFKKDDKVVACVAGAGFLKLRPYGAIEIRLLLLLLLLVQFSFSDDGVERELCGRNHGYKCDQFVERIRL